MKKKTTPIITYTEILSRAISSIKAEIEEWESKCSSLPQEQRGAMLVATTGELVEKLDTLKTLYRIETGNDFD